MKKSVYIITNKIDHKVYIGLSNDPAIRWRNHKQRAREGQRQNPLYQAMRELGVENFYYTILEKDIENGEERELFWIDFFNSREPNGYNVEAQYKHNAAFKDKATVEEIKNLLKKTALPYKQIGKKYGVSYKVVSDINTGRSYYDPAEHYPLRIKECEHYEIIKQLHYALQYETEKTTKQIAKEYKMSEKLVNAINKGEYGVITGKKYPLRGVGRSHKLSDEQVELIQRLLMTTNQSFEKIAMQANCSADVVKRINSGVNHQTEAYDYPLRVTNSGSRTCLSPNEVDEIKDLLSYTDESLSSIARKYCVMTSVIAGINSGKTKKYHDEGTVYPIRRHA